jgi:hypothetical protein
MGGEERLLVILTTKKGELLLNRPEPMISIERILSSREDRRLSPQKVREVVSAHGPTSSMRSRVAHESLQERLVRLEESVIRLAVLLDLHEHIRHGRRWRRVVLTGTLRNLSTTPSDNHS